MRVSAILADDAILTGSWCEPMQRKLAIIPTDFEPILLIDPDAAHRKIVRTMLDRLGIKKVTELESFTEISTIKSEKFRLLVCEISLAPISGIEFARVLRQDPQLGRLAIILITASRDVEFGRNVRSIRGVSILLKPFNQSALSSALARVNPFYHL